MNKDDDDLEFLQKMKKDDIKRMYTNVTAMYQQELTEIDEDIQSNKEIAESSPESQGICKFKMARLHIKSSFINITLNEIFNTFYSVKNQTYTKNIRSECNLALTCLEEIVSPIFDLTLEENREKVECLNEIDIKERLYLVKSTAVLLDLIEEQYKNDSKLKWLVGEFRGRHAIVTKNLVDLKVLVKNKDPFNCKEYKLWYEYMKLIEKLLQEAAAVYRRKYEVYSEVISDFETAIRFLEVLDKFYSQIEDGDKKTQNKKQMEVWQHKLESDKEKKA